MKVLILAGGGGTRLWPLSTESNPKQFILIPGIKNSLFQITLKRALGFCDSKNIFVLTSQNFKINVIKQASMIGVDLAEGQVFLESKRLNTLPAIVSGLKFAKTNDEEEVLVLPSDHILDDEQSLIAAVEASGPYLNSNIAIFGAKPTYPHTGYGYIQPGALLSSNVSKVNAFKEKPDFDTARSYLKQGYLWNAGIFYFNFGHFKRLLFEHQPEMAKHFLLIEDVEKAFDEWSLGVSIDYGLLEKTKNIVVSKIYSGWTDIGSFDSLIEYLKIHQPLLQEIQGSGSVLITDDVVKTVIIGVDDLIIVNSKNGHLVCKKGESQLVKEIK